MMNDSGCRERSSDTGPAFEEAFARLIELQLRQVSHWSQIIHTAAERFATRNGTASASSQGVDDFMKAYEVWIECAEQSYAEAVCTEEYCRLQSELANTALKLLLEGQACLDSAPKGRT